MGTRYSKPPAEAALAPRLEQTWQQEGNKSNNQPAVTAIASAGHSGGSISIGTTMSMTITANSSKRHCNAVEHMGISA